MYLSSFLLCKMTKLSNEKERIIGKVVKSFTLRSTSDKATVITRNCAAAAIPTINALTEDIIRLFPKYNSNRVRHGVRNAKHAITVLRELLRLKDRKILSMKTYKWNKTLKKKYCEFTYRII